MIDSAVQSCLVQAQMCKWMGGCQNGFLDHPVDMQFRYVQFDYTRLMITRQPWRRVNVCNADTTSQVHWRWRMYFFRCQIETAPPP